MAKVKKQAKKQLPEVTELKALTKALDATQHNPIGWGLVFAYIAPIIARLAVRIALSYYTRRTGKKISPTVKAAVLDYTKDLITTKVK